jgi:hypothetical protein
MNATISEKLPSESGPTARATSCRTATGVGEDCILGVTLSSEAGAGAKARAGAGAGGGAGAGAGALFGAGAGAGAGSGVG